MPKAYKSLDKQVRNMILKVSGQGGSAIDSQAGADMASASTASINESISNVVGDLSEMVKPWIKKGLDITASGPYDEYITISSGAGFAGGIKHELAQTTRMPIPLSDSFSSVWYVNLYNDSIDIETTTYDTKLNIGKVIIPNPGVTDKIRDAEDYDSWDGYIISAKDAFYDENTILDDVSKQIIKDVVHVTFAEDIIGNIVVSDSLAITNKHGTLKITSEDVQILYEDEETAAKFTKNGSFFYNSNGVEVAKFASNEARIGNIRVTENTVESGDYQSNVRGFRIRDDGYAEFDDVKVRGKIQASVLEYNTTSAVNGELIVSNASVLKDRLLTTDTSITVEESVFSVNEILKIKIGTNAEYLQVTDISNAPIYTVVRDLSGVGITSDWEKGTAIVSIGVSGKGYVDINATDSYGPFIDIVTRNSAVYNDVSTKARIGNLEGIISDNYGTLSGSGVWFDGSGGGVYLENGRIVSPLIQTDISGSRIELNADGLFMYGDADNYVFSASLQSGAGGDVGDFVIGDVVTDNYIQWDDSEGTLTVRGDISATSLTANEVQTAESGARTEIDSDGIRVYDGSVGDPTIFEAITTGAGLGLLKLLGVMNIGSSSGGNGQVFIDGENESIKVYGDTVTIDQTNNIVDWEEDSTPHYGLLDVGSYTPTELAQKLESAMSTGSSSVSYNSSSRKITIEAGLGVSTLDILWNSGDNAEYTCAYATGFDPSADDTGALSYEADWQTALRLEMGQLT